MPWHIESIDEMKIGAYYYVVGSWTVANDDKKHSNLVL